MSVVEIVDHPLIQHKISLLRDRNTPAPRSSVTW